MYWTRRKCRLLLLVGVLSCVLGLFYFSDRAAKSINTVKVPSQNSYLSPALLLEYPEVENCMDKYVLAPSTDSKHVVVYGHHSAKALRTIQTYLNNGNGVIFLSTEPLPRVYSEKLYQFLQAHGQLKLVSGHGSCKKRTVEKAFTDYDVTTLHVAFDPEDFLPYDSHEKLGGIMACYIEILEAVSRRKHIPIVFDVSLHRTRPKVPAPLAYSNVTNSIPEVVSTSDISGDVVYAIDRKHRTCKTKFDYNDFHDVFLKSLEIYTTTYAKLYDLNKSVIVT